MAFFRTLTSISIIAFLASFVATSPTPSLSATLCKELRAHNLGLGLGLDEAACNTLHATTNVPAVTRDLVAVDANVHAKVHLNLLNTLNGLSVTLLHDLSGLLAVVAGLSADGVVSTLSHIVVQVEASLPLIQNLEVCTDATVAAATYKALGVFVASQQKISAFITANVSLLVRLDLKVSLRAVLISLQQALSIYVDHLFHHISADLDTLNLRVSLFTSIQAAIDACV